MNSQQDNRPGRGIYLLPNLLTTGGLFAGFYAIIAALKGQFDVAAIAIFVAMVMDGLDGRVARMTNTQTPFGAEYDSLSDMAAFGIAPALVAYSWMLGNLGKPGWLAAFIYAAAGALRLARFNTQPETTDKRWFSGLSITAAAGIVAGMMWVSYSAGWQGRGASILVALLMISIGVLMVSNIRYYSFKELDLKGKVPFVAILIVVLIFVFISIDPPVVLFVSFLLYGLSGPAGALLRMFKNGGFSTVRLRSRSKRKGPTAEESETHD